MTLTRITADELEEAVSLYRSAIGQPGCSWSEIYPTREILQEDIARGDLYGVHENGRIIASIAVDLDPMTETLACWSEALQPGREFSRVVVAKDHQNRGIAQEMVRAICIILKKQGYRSIRYLVDIHNTRAVRSYAHFHFRQVGETDLWNEHFLCFEKEL